jgi:hypothetical protein
MSPALAQVLAGAEVDAADTRTYKDWDGARTPLHYAAHYGKLAHFKTLIDLGADLRKMSKVRVRLGYTAMETVANSDVSGLGVCPSFKGHSLSPRAEPSRYDSIWGGAKVGWSALFYAVENAKKKPGRKEDSNWHLQLVEWIVDQDLAGNVWCTASNGRTPLMLAAIQVRRLTLTLTRTAPLPTLRVKRSTSTRLKSPNPHAPGPRSVGDI